MCIFRFQAFERPSLLNFVRTVTSNDAGQLRPGYSHQHAPPALPWAPKLHFPRCFPSKSLGSLREHNCEKLDCGPWSSADSIVHCGAPSIRCQQLQDHNVSRVRSRPKFIELNTLDFLSVALATAMDHTVPLFAGGGGLTTGSVASSRQSHRRGHLGRTPRI